LNWIDVGLKTIACLAGCCRASALGAHYIQCDRAVLFAVTMGVRSISAGGPSKAPGSTCLEVNF
jgi:hypothetical protein